MTPDEHYAEADDLLTAAREQSRWEDVDLDNVDRIVRRAQAHATLAARAPQRFEDHAVELAEAHRDRDVAQATADDLHAQFAAVLNWAADEIDAQATAHRVTEPQLLDLTDHIRCFADQPHRRSLIPWPDGVRRPLLDPAPSA